MKSSIIDVPRKYTEEDLFGINKYQKALTKFIKLTNTPITIALQGEWGSGKTSLMNQLRWELCDSEGAIYFPVWINTWQYSLMKTPSQAIISILEGCINQIGALNPNVQKWDESKKKIGGIFKKMATVGAKMAASTVGIDGGTVDELFATEASTESEILQLKNEISKLIDEALATESSKLGFTFYIDDLDRIDPPVAVEILELLKNIFDLDKCVFILAIDYDVVIKGCDMDAPIKPAPAIPIFLKSILLSSFASFYQFLMQNIQAACHRNNHSAYRRSPNDRMSVISIIPNRRSNSKARKIVAFKLMRRPSFRDACAAE